jgi:hypothetical protein
MDQMPDETYTVQTAVGKFRVERTTNRHAYSGAYQYEILRVGGKKFCIFIKFNRTTPSIAELQWLITNEGGGELTDKEIRGTSAQHLLYLSITILKTFIPQVHTLTLLDNSKIQCTLSPDTARTVFLDKYYFILHGQTWYERMFSANPLGENTRITYKLKQAKLSDPQYKPHKFDFRNNDLDTLFSPIFETSATWAEFGQRISEKYSPACSYLFPWYLQAVAYIMDNESFPEYWSINTSSAHVISYKRLTNGGNRRARTSSGRGLTAPLSSTRKLHNYRSLNTISEQYESQMSPDEIYNIKYT